MAETRRPHGTGTATQDHGPRYGCPAPVGGRRPPHQCDAPWYAVVEAGWTPSGTRRRIRRKASPSTKSAALKLSREMARRDAPTGTARLTVKAWADLWLDTQSQTLRPSSYGATRGAVRRWIVPTIGHRRLDALTPGDVRSVSRAMVAGGLASATVGRHHGELLRMLRDARLDGHQVRPELLDVSPTRQASAPGRGDIPLLDALRILTAAASEPDGSRWVAALLQGIRPAEARGLTWAEVHDESVGVEWQLASLPYRVPYDRSSGYRVPTGYEARHLVDAYHLVRPKTGRGVREHPLVPWMRESLAQWRKVSKPNPYDLVWPTDRGRPRSDKYDRARWRELCDKAGVPRYDLYSCRHSTVSLLLEAGVSHYVVEAIVGHAKLVDAYVHVSDRQVLDALSGLAGTLGLTK